MKAQTPPSHQPLRGVPLILTLIVIGATLSIGVFLLFHDLHPAEPSVQTRVINPTTTGTTTTGTTTTGTITVATADGLTLARTFVDPSPANFDKKVFNLNNPDALRKTSENSWSVKGGRLFMQVHRNAAGALVVRFVYPYEDFLPKDTVAMLRTRWIMTETYKLLDELAITPEQWQKLSALKLNTDTQISGEDRRKIMALFKEAIAATPNEVVNAGQPTVSEEKLTDFLRELDEKYYDTTIARANKLASDVKAIFTDLQFTGLMRRYGTW
jgi:hypothetical protein